MKVNLRNCFKAGFFLLGLIIILTFFSNIFVPKDSTAQHGSHEGRAMGILAEKDNSIDVLIIGDSESYCAFSPMEMWNSYGFTSYAGGSSAQKISETYEYLVAALEKQKPSVVVFETNLLKNKITGNHYIRSKLRTNFPIFEYHNMWKSTPIKDYFLAKPNYVVNDYKGYYLRTDIKPASTENYMKPSDEIWEIEDLNLFVLKEMANVSQKNGAQFVLVSSPSTLNWNYKKHNAVQIFADKNNLDYFDMNLVADDIGIDWSVDTRDKGDHLNHSGAVKASVYLGKYLQENYNLPDHRNDEDYADWNRSLEKYNKKVAEASK